LVASVKQLIIERINNMPEVNGKEPSQKVKSLLANWDVKKHQPYATHKAFVKVSKEIAELKEMIIALANKK